MSVEDLGVAVIGHPRPNDGSECHVCGHTEMAFKKIDEPKFKGKVLACKNCGAENGRRIPN